MKKKIIFFLFLLHLGSVGFAKQELKSDKTFDAKSNDFFKVEIIFGDKESVFSVNQGKNHQFIYKLNGQILRDKRLGRKNLQFLFGKVFEILKTPSNNPELCSRDKMILRTSTSGVNSERTACVGSKTKVAVGLTELINSMNLLL